MAMVFGPKFHMDIIAVVAGTTVAAMALELQLLHAVLHSGLL